MEELIELLHNQECSCVICHDDETLLCHGRGVKDIHRIFKQNPEFLKDSLIADKVVGKGAAALMVLGGVKKVYADLISRPALNLLETSGIPVSYMKLVDGIKNRNGDGPCPVEATCMDCLTPEECLPRIDAFIKSMKAN